MPLRTRTLLLLPALLCAGCFTLPTDPFARSTAGGGGKSGGTEESSSSSKGTGSKDYFQALVGDPKGDAPHGGGTGSGGGGEGASESFADQALRIQKTVAGWDFGTGIGAQFVSDKSGEKMLLMYADPAAPVMKRDVGMWAIDATAKVDGKAAARFVILTKSFSPGRYQAGPRNTDLIVISVLGGNLEINSEEAMSSINPGAAVELVLKPAEKKGDVEGLFRGKLASKDGGSYQHVDSGYLYVNR